MKTPHNDDASLPGYPGARIPGEAHQEGGRKPHVHAAVIKAWADGAEIQYRVGSEWFDTTCPAWYPDKEYRVKPLPPKVETVYTRVTMEHGTWSYFEDRSQVRSSGHNLKVVFIDGKLEGAEVLGTHWRIRGAGDE